MARILFFARARELIGHDELVWPIEIPQYEEDLWAWLASHDPAFGTLKAGCRIACNGEYLSQDGLIMPEDEIAIIPPVSGG